MNVFKVLVTGDFSSGKTQFIKTLTGNVLLTEKKVTDKKEMLQKDTTTVALDYGKLEIGKNIIHLFGTPGQKRFDFMLNVLDRNISAFIVLVDSTNIVNIKNARRFIEFFNKGNLPFVVACNKQDLKDAYTLDQIKSFLDMDVPLMPLVAKDRESSLKLLQYVLSKIDQPVLV